MYNAFSEYNMHIKVTLSHSHLSLPEHSKNLDHASSFSSSLTFWCMSLNNCLLWYASMTAMVICWNCMLFFTILHLDIITFSLKVIHKKWSIIRRNVTQDKITKLWLAAMLWQAHNKLKPKVHYFNLLYNLLWSRCKSLDLSWICCIKNWFNRVWFTAVYTANFCNSR